MVKKLELAGYLHPDIGELLLFVVLRFNIGLPFCLAEYTCNYCTLGF